MIIIEHLKKLDCQGLDDQDQNSVCLSNALMIKPKNPRMQHNQTNHVQYPIKILISFLATNGIIQKVLLSRYPPVLRIRQDTSTYVITRHHTSVYVSIRQDTVHTSTTTQPVSRFLNQTGECRAAVVETSTII